MTNHDTNPQRDITRYSLLEVLLSTLKSLLCLSWLFYNLKMRRESILIPKSCYEHMTLNSLGWPQDSENQGIDYVLEHAKRIYSIWGLLFCIPKSQYQYGTGIWYLGNYYYFFFVIPYGDHFGGAVFFSGRGMKFSA